MDEEDKSSAGVSPAVKGAPRPRSGEIIIRQRGHHPLPHWETDGGTYFVTFRLDDSVPDILRQEVEEQGFAVEAAKRQTSVSKRS